MGEIVEIAKDINQEMAESQHKDLEMYRKLGVLEVHRLEGLNDEECELAWLDAIRIKDDAGLYVAEPGIKHEL
jgi:hypothetical protein